VELLNIWHLKLSLDPNKDTEKVLIGGHLVSSYMNSLQGIFYLILRHPPFYDMKPLGIYQKILKGIIEFPSFLSLRSKDLIRKLLNPEVKYRLGVSDVIYFINSERTINKRTQVVQRRRF